MRLEYNKNVIIRYRHSNKRVKECIYGTIHKELFPDKSNLRIRFSLGNPKRGDDVLNIPLFVADRSSA